MTRTTLRLCVALLAVVITTMGGCTTGVEESPQPGIIRVTLESNPEDTSIVIVIDTITVTTEDSIDLTVFQGTVTSADGRFATLLPRLTSYRQEDKVYNILRRENGEYVRAIIFECYVPPQSFDAVQIGLTASVLKFHYQAPITIQPPLDTLRFVTIRGLGLSVQENRVTEINLQINPLKALTRYRDVYQMDFRDNITLLGVRTY